MADNIYAKNLEEYGKMISFERTLDLVKLDAAEDLLPDALEAQRTEAAAAHAAVGNAKGDWRTVTLDRATLADQLASRASQAVAAFEGRGASAEKIKQARFYVRKLQGKRAGERPADDPSTPDVDESENAISVSQRSNAARISNFTELVDYLEAQEEYADINNPEIKISGLRAFVESVAAKHDASIRAATALTDKRITRDKIFFDNEDSMLNRARRLKKTVGGAYGYDSPEYKTMNGFEVRRRD